MSYTALYRKWRPPVFDDVKGQDPIVKALKNQIVSGRIGHAYLFCGTRGTGKTSVAKILARAVNCEHPVDGNPCNECPSCQAALVGNSMNVMEIDAASNNGVDNIREIRDEVRYAPTEGRYKVYIIDEVHMLSTGAFNALLKTLEEPPAHVIFILATTEVHKIPITVLSRCQRYDFRRIAAQTIAARLTQLVEGEGVEAEPQAIRYVARKADGSMRDSISLLDQCIAFHYGELLTYEKVLDVLGAASYDLFGRLLQAVLECRTADCINMIDEIVMQGTELGQMVSDFIWYLRNIMMLQASDLDADTLEVSEAELRTLADMSEKVDQDTLLRYIRILSELSGRIRNVTDKRVLLETTFIKMMKPESEDNYDSLLQRLKQLEEKLAKGFYSAGVSGNGANGYASGGVGNMANVNLPAGADHLEGFTDTSGYVGSGQGSNYYGDPYQGYDSGYHPGYDQGYDQMYAQGYMDHDPRYDMQHASGPDYVQMPDNQGNPGITQVERIEISSDQMVQYETLRDNWDKLVARMQATSARMTFRHARPEPDPKGNGFVIIFDTDQNYVIGARDPYRDDFVRVVKEQYGAVLAFRFQKESDSTGRKEFVSVEKVQSVFSGIDVEVE